MSIDVLKVDIKNSDIRKLYLFYGPEEYLKKYYLKEIEKKLVLEDLREISYRLFDGKCDVQALIDACDAFPLMSERKLVVVKNSGLFKTVKKASDERKSSSDHERLVVYLQKIPEETCLIFIENEIDKRIKLVDVIKKNGLVAEFAYQEAADLCKWIKKALNAMGKDIEPKVASYLMESCDEGMGNILSEINKLANYLKDKNKVEMEDIDTICSKSLGSRIFDLTDAISEKNTGRALEVLDDLIIMKEPVPKILFMISRQFRLMIESRLLNQMGLNAAEIAGRLGLHPFAAGKIMKYSRNFSIDDLKTAYFKCFETDIAIKTGQMAERTALELLIAAYYF